MLARCSLAFVMACSLGRPAPRAAGLEVAEVRSSFVEPGLGESLHAELSAALASRGVEAEGDPVDVQVLDASTRVVGWEGEVRVLSARLELELKVGGSHPRSTRLVLEESFAVSQDAVDEGSEARRLAFSSLAGRAAEDAADWLLFAPREG